MFCSSLFFIYAKGNKAIVFLLLSEINPLLDKNSRIADFLFFVLSYKVL